MKYIEIYTLITGYSFHFKRLFGGWLASNKIKKRRLEARTMRRYLLFMVFLLLSGCLGGSASWERVDVEGFNEAINDHPEGFLLDVRTASEWEQDGHLENATLIPHTELESRENELPSDKDSLILLYCRSGNRSQDAAKTLQDLGFTNLIELESGITGWKNAGMPVVYG